MVRMPFLSIKIEFTLPRLQPTFHNLTVWRYKSISLYHLSHSLLSLILPLYVCLSIKLFVKQSAQIPRNIFWPNLPSPHQCCWNNSKTTRSSQNLGQMRLMLPQIVHIFWPHTWNIQQYRQYCVNFWLLKYSKSNLGQKVKTTVFSQSFACPKTYLFHCCNLLTSK